MPLTLAQQARIAKKKQDALDRKRQKEAEREQKRARHEEQEQAAAPAPAPEVPRGLRAHNGIGLREAPLHARRRSVPVRRFSAEAEDEPAAAPPAPAAPHPPPAAASVPAPAPAVPPPAGGVAATPSSGAMAWVLASELAAAETPAAPPAPPRAVTESPPSPPAAAREPVPPPASPLRFDEASDDDGAAARNASDNGAAAAAAPEPDASDEDSVVFLGSNNAAPAPAPPPAPAPAPALVPAEEEGPRCGHGKLATEHCPQCAAFLAYEASHGMLVLDQSLAAEGAPPPPSHVIVGKPRTSLDKAEECVVCICVESNARRRREILISTQVCMDNVGSQVLNPCAHRVCDGCAKKLGECPMCRTKMIGFRGGAAFMPVGSPEGRAIVAAARGEVVPAPAPAPAAAPRRTKPRNVLERWVGASSSARPAKKPASRCKKL